MLLELVPVLRHFLHRQSHRHGRLNLIRSYIQQKESVYLCFPAPTNISFLLYTHLKPVVLCGMAWPFPHGSVNFDIEDLGPSFSLTPSSFFGGWHLILLVLVFSWKTFCRRVLQKIVGVSHTIHINKHPSTHIHSTRIPPIRIPPLRIRSIRIHSKGTHVSCQYISFLYISI